MDLSAIISTIGNDIVVCRRGCDGVVSNPTLGIIPRGLTLETRSAGHTGAIILGMNPGQGDEAERRTFQADGSFDATVRFMREHRLLKHQYYLRLRALADGCAHRGDLLWTELAKCQSDADWHGSLPLETYRTCAAAFLRQEVDATPTSWPIFAVGRDAYRAAAFMFCERPVVGVAHPTGSYGLWHAMFTGAELKPSVSHAVQRLLTSRRAAWIPDELMRGERPDGTD